MVSGTADVEMNISELTSGSVTRSSDVSLTDPNDVTDGDRVDMGVFTKA